MPVQVGTSKLNIHKAPGLEKQTKEVFGVTSCKLFSSIGFSSCWLEGLIASRHRASSHGFPPQLLWLAGFGTPPLS